MYTHNVLLLRGGVGSVFLNRSALCVFRVSSVKSAGVFMCLSVTVCAWNEAAMGGREHQAKTLGWNADNTEQREAEKSTLMEISEH